MSRNFWILVWISPISCWIWCFSFTSEGADYPCLIVYLIYLALAILSIAHQDSLERCFTYRFIQGFAILDQLRSHRRLCAFWIRKWEIWLTWAFWRTVLYWFKFWLFSKFSWSSWGRWYNHWRVFSYH